jgi:succinyl-diaminopimelate desuccinylase
MDPLPLLQDLIRIPSVNPMGRDLSGDEFYETRLSAFLAEFFTRLDVPFELQEFSVGRTNVIARIGAPAATETLVFDAHQDTVPTDGMTIPPFDPRIDGDRVYGRGACDVKGGMAMMLAAFARARAQVERLRCNVVMSCTVDEEYQANGVTLLAKSWSGRAPSKLLASRPHAAIIAEPTDLDVVVAHRGATRWKIVTHGRACHSSEPQLGVNAIYQMAEVVRHLKSLAAELPTLHPAHPLCGGATLSVGRIVGGTSVNVVPDRCEVEIDRRVVPGEDSLAVIPEVTEYLRSRVDFDFEVQPPWIVGLPLGDQHNQAIGDALLETINSVTGPRRKIGVPYGTNASRFQAEGVPSIVFGPGSIRQAHTKDEWLSISELRLATDILERFVVKKA